ncbi:uncharacterized protein [Battus philenor]|uniref:uncharacterized protein n=1 Tax=Battus philenor TaxID=42288 RepID=UPI0035CF4A12
MIRGLSPELADIAKTELNENPKQTPDDVKHLKEWIMKQPHLKARTDDQWLVAILRGCKFSLERVKAKLDLYYTLRTTSPEVTLRLKPTEMKFLDFLRLGTCIILPKPKTGLYPRVILIRAGRYDPEVNSVADIMCILYYLVQILVVEDDTATVLGTKIVVDYDGVTLNHLMQANPNLLKKIVAVSQDSLPLRLKGSHHLNVPSGIEVIFKLVSSFLNEKARQRLKIHKNAEELFEHVPKEIVPSEYGGSGSTVEEIIEYWADKIIEYKSWMEVEEKLGTDESKRISKPLNQDDFGNQGSFRQLLKKWKLKMTVRPLSATLQEKAKKEVNENPRSVQSDISALKTWLQKQPHLHTVNPSDQWLVAFLRGSKFSLERCKEKLDMYYTMRTVVPEFFSNRDPLDSRIQGILKLGAFLPLRNCKENDAPRICIVRIGVYNPSEYNLSDLLKVAFMITEIMMLEDDNFTVSGEEVIVDIKNVGVNVLSQWTPALAKKVITCFEKALPVRLKSNHILNTPTGFEAAYTIFKAFLGEKLKKRIRVHNQDYDALYKEIPKKVLPKEYGGDEGEIQELTDHWLRKVESYRDWFLKEENARSDESKRPGKPKTTSTLFGIEGSFRQLEVD